VKCYHGTATIARTLNVHPASIRYWHNTFEQSPLACPEPEVRIGRVYGWSDAGLVEWAAWYRRYKETSPSAKGR
jgi:hypothetical protein